MEAQHKVPLAPLVETKRHYVNTVAPRLTWEFVECGFVWAGTD